MLDAALFDKLEWIAKPNPNPSPNPDPDPSHSPNQAREESALLAEIGVADTAPPAFRGAEEGAPAEPLSAQQLEAQFYADLAAELRDVDF